MGAIVFILHNSPCVGQWDLFRLIYFYRGTALNVLAILGFIWGKAYIQS